MGRLLTTTAMILAASVSAGCYPCMQNSYYDPCCGVVYGPSVTTKTPTFLSGLKKHKHDKDSCPLCNADAPPAPYGTPGIPPLNGGSPECCQQHGATHQTTAYRNPADYGAAFGQPVSHQHGHSPGCGCSSSQHCSAGCPGGKRSQAWQANGHTGCSCSTPVTNCPVCEPCQHQLPVSHCDTCSTIGESYSNMGDSYPGVVYDGSFPTDSYSSEQYSSDPMILPGETIIDGDTFHPESFHSSGNCPHCQSTSGPIVSDPSSGSHSNGGPIFEGTIIPGDEYNVSPGYEADKPTSPMPAPAAEAAPGETVTPTPEPEPLPASTTMMIPTFPAPKPARQVHWVPNTLK